MVSASRKGFAHFAVFSRKFVANWKLMAGKEGLLVKVLLINISVQEAQLVLHSNQGASLAPGCSCDVIFNVSHLKT